MESSLSLFVNAQLGQLASDPEHSSTATPAVGQLTGIGVGPGDPELLTVKALRLLQAAPVVAFPAGRNGQLGMAQQIIAPWLQPHQVQLPLTFSFDRDPAVLEAAWQGAAVRVWPYLNQGQDVVFASEGDISFYSTFTYLAQTLQQEHPELQVRAVPGVCSPLAAAAAVGHPLTIQGEKLAILPALYAPEELEAALDWAEVVVLMKVSSVYSQVWEILRRRGLLHQSYAIAHISHPQQHIYRDLSQYADLKLPYFSLLVVQATPNPLA